MTFSFLQIIILFILVLETSTVYSFLNNVTDKQSLLSVKTSITTDPLGALTSWNNSIHFCQWTGVKCSGRRQRVTSLNLSSQHLVGTLSPYIGNLSFLREIDLHQNNFYGSIPSEIGRLSRLQYLSLANNSFQGGFPHNLSHCIDIKIIRMYGNNLEGELPTEFASWSNLYMFDVGSNHFTGSIPPSIGNMSSIRALILSNNNLTGSIPLEVSHFAKLEILFLSKNNLRGMVPLPLYNISSLFVVNLDNNELKGTLPADFGFTLPNLQEFNAGGNRFSGPLPSSIANASNLRNLQLWRNYITGPMPIILGSLTNLQQLELSENPLGDNQLPNDLSFFNSLINCTNLYVLGLAKSGLRGQLPNSIVNLSTTIEVLYLYGNQLHGIIPHEIGKLENLMVLSLHQNFLAGTIPESVGELSKLGELYLCENSISGAIPSSISNITQLGELCLSNNMLQGSIPTELFNIPTLQTLSLANNKLGGVIPDHIGFSSQCIFLFLAQNLFTGSLPSSIGGLKQLVQLDVSHNKLTGDIPASLGDCVMLEELHMGGNLFEGRIPSSLKALKSIKHLDLSNNNMSGSIPSIFDGFGLLEFLNLSYNKLEGEVPKESPFQNFSAFSVAGNLQLCGGIQALQLPSCSVETSSISLKKVLLLVLLPLSFLLSCLAFIYNRQRKSKQMNVHVPVWQENQYPRVSYEDLLLATNEFSPKNLLGAGRYGSVYKGCLESQDQIVAVKVLNIDVRGAKNSFLAECKTLKNIRHRNLIKIITACSTTDFKGNDFIALVYEFMMNGSLDSWLHQTPSHEGYGRNLTLLQRLNISIDVALGVDYLHNHSHTSIIHCDIKPSNVLLDKDFVAHVGDFGLARLIFSGGDIDQAHIISATGVCGTIGYVPPEYGMGGEISAEGDVYSYGILLLEIFSGKRPTCSSILLNNCNNLHDYVKKALPQRVMDIVDPWIVLYQEDHGLTTNQLCSRATMELCVALIFEVGILCSVEMPAERINISAAIKQLHVARDMLLQGRQP